MTREHARQLLPIIKAWSEGAEVQVQVCGSTPPHWVMLDENPAFTSHPDSYRIKPQPREWWILNEQLYQNEADAMRVYAKLVSSGYPCSILGPLKVVEAK